MPAILIEQAVYVVEILRSFYRNTNHLFVQYLSVLDCLLLSLVRGDCRVVKDEWREVVKHLIKSEQLAIVDNIRVRFDFNESLPLVSR